MTEGTLAEQPTRNPLLSLPREPRFWAVATGHMTNDIFMNMGSVLLVFMSTTIVPMTTAQIGLAVSVREIFGSVSQPLFGLRGDRTGGHWLAAGGVAWLVGWLIVAMALAATGNFWLMVIPFALSGLGSAAFHPVGAMHAAETDQARETTNTAYFFLFGRMGLALGPAIAGFLLEDAARLIPAFERAANPLAPIFALTIIAIPPVASMFLTVPHHKDRPAREPRPKTEKTDPTPTTTRARRAAKGAVILMVVIVFIRSAVSISSVNFAPALFERKGWTPSEYGLITGSFWFASAISGVVFGRLADHLDRRWIVAATLGPASLPLFFLPLINSPFAFVLALASGALLGGSFSIIVVLVQHTLPTGRAFASGAILGFSFVSGAVGNLGIGILADGPAALFGAAAATSGGIGLEATFQVMAALALAGGLMTLALPRWVSGRDRPAT